MAARQRRSPRLRRAILSFTALVAALCLTLPRVSPEALRDFLGQAAHPALPTAPSRQRRCNDKRSQRTLLLVGDDDGLLDAAPADNSGLELLGELAGLAVFAFVVFISGLVWLLQQSGPPEGPDKKALYTKWGVRRGSLSDSEKKNFTASATPDLAREKRVARSVLSKSYECRDFWEVDRFGRELSQNNTSYSLINHINMVTDTKRVEAYRAALNATASQCRALDLGTGAFCLLGRLALSAGAQSVDCVEQSEGAVDHAISVLKREADGFECTGLREANASLGNIFWKASCEERPGSNPRALVSLQKQTEPGINELRVFQGLSSDVALDGKYDLVVHEILGHIASSEGVGPAVSDLAKRGLLAENCKFVPQRAVTLFAPTAVLEQSVSEKYVSLQYGSDIGNFKVLTKYHASRFTSDSFLAQPDVFEDLEFGPNLDLHQTRKVEFRTFKEGVFDGLHFHMFVDMGGGGVINTLAEETSWQTTYVKMFEEGISLPEGSTIVCTTSAKMDLASPEYSVEVTVPSVNRTATFTWSGST